MCECVCECVRERERVLAIVSDRAVTFGITFDDRSGNPSHLQSLKNTPLAFLRFTITLFYPHSKQNYFSQTLEQIARFF